MDIQNVAGALGGAAAIVAALAGLWTATREASKPWRLRRQIAHDLEMISKLPEEGRARRNLSILVTRATEELMLLDVHPYPRGLLASLIFFGAIGAAMGASAQKLDMFDWSQPGVHTGTLILGIVTYLIALVGIAVVDRLVSRSRRNFRGARRRQLEAEQADREPVD